MSRSAKYQKTFNFQIMGNIILALFSTTLIFVLVIHLQSRDASHKDNTLSNWSDSVDILPNQIEFQPGHFKRNICDKIECKPPPTNAECVATDDNDLTIRRADKGTAESCCPTLKCFTLDEKGYFPFNGAVGSGPYYSFTEDSYSNNELQEDYQDTFTSGPAVAPSCDSISCQEPPSDADCSVLKEWDPRIPTVTGEKSKCCPLYRCFTRDGFFLFPFHGLLGKGPLLKIKEPEDVSSNDLIPLEKVDWHRKGVNLEKLRRLQRREVKADDKDNQTTTTEPTTTTSASTTTASTSTNATTSTTQPSTTSTTQPSTTSTTQPSTTSTTQPSTTTTATTTPESTTTTTVPTTTTNVPANASGRMFGGNMFGNMFGGGGGMQMGTFSTPSFSIGKPIASNTKSDSFGILGGGGSKKTGGSDMLFDANDILANAMADMPPMDNFFAMEPTSSFFGSPSPAPAPVPAPAPAPKPAPSFSSSGNFGGSSSASSFKSGTTTNKAKQGTATSSSMGTNKMQQSSSSFGGSSSSFGGSKGSFQAQSHATKAAAPTPPPPPPPPPPQPSSLDFGEDDYGSPASNAGTESESGSLDLSKPEPAEAAPEQPAEAAPEEPAEAAAPEPTPTDLGDQDYGSPASEPVDEAPAAEPETHSIKAQQTPAATNNFGGGFSMGNSNKPAPAPSPAPKPMKKQEPAAAPAANPFGGMNMFGGGMGMFSSPSFSIGSGTKNSFGIFGGSGSKKSGGSDMLFDASDILNEAMAAQPKMEPITMNLSPTFSIGASTPASKSSIGIFGGSQKKGSNEPLFDASEILKQSKPDTADIDLSSMGAEMLKAQQSPTGSSSSTAGSQKKTSSSSSRVEASDTMKTAKPADSAPSPSPAPAPAKEPSPSMGMNTMKQPAPALSPSFAPSPSSAGGSTQSSSSSSSTASQQTSADIGEEDYGSSSGGAAQESSQASETATAPSASAAPAPSFQPKAPAQPAPTPAQTDAKPQAVDSNPFGSFGFNMDQMQPMQLSFNFGSSALKGAKGASNVDVDNDGIPDMIVADSDMDEDPEEFQKEMQNMMGVFGK